MSARRHTFVSRLFSRLQPVVGFIHQHYWLVILGALVLTASSLYPIIGGFIFEGAPKIKVNTNLSSLIPENYKSVQSLNRIKETVSGIDKLEVLIQSEDFEASLRFARVLIPALLELKNPETNENYIASIEYRNEVEFFEKNQLLFVKMETLNELKDAIDNRVEEEKNKLNPLFVDDLFGDESDDAAAEDVMSLEDLEKEYDKHIPSEYLATKDGSILMLRCYPYGSATNLERSRRFYNTVQDLIASHDIKAYHPTMFTELGGEVRNRVEEFDVITSDAKTNLGGGLLLQILLIIIYFRQPLRLGDYPSMAGKIFGLIIGFLRQLVAALLIALPLLMAIIWTFGLTQIVIGGLNTITVFLFVILFGMGIDFGIHIYSRYLETRLNGSDVLASLQTAITKTGAGVFTAAVTTSAAFYSLQVTDFKGFSDFGFIAGTGILSAMLAMLFLLPAFVTLGEKIGLIDAVSVTLKKSSDVSARQPFKHYRVIFGATLAVIVVVAIFLPKLGFEYNFRNLRSNLPNLQSVKAKIHDLKMDAEGSDLGTPAIILADSHEDLNELLAVLEVIKKNDVEKPTIAKIESIFDKFPQRQEDKLETRKTVNEEALDVVKGEDKRRLERLQVALQVEHPFTIEDVPMSVKRKFIGKDGSIGEFVLIYPSVLLRDGKNSIEFAKDLRSLSTMDGISTPSGKVYYASSGSIIAADTLLLLQHDAKIAILVSTLMIILFIFLDFRSLRNTLIVLFPLLAGFFFLFGIQLIFDIKYNLFNMIVIPVIIGYGVDDSIHIVHRYFEEGSGSISRVLRTTGWVVFMTTLTTSAGFSGLSLVSHGGLNSMGNLALIGLSIMMLTALFILPSALRLLEGSKAEKPSK
ncbi:MMPL family transporter, partial [candidate division KSB1 bacterium]|nr:MMPL family transporter [candidate division KSB1 bacterium]